VARRRGWRGSRRCCRSSKGTVTHRDARRGEGEAEREAASNTPTRAKPTRLASHASGCVQLYCDRLATPSYTPSSGQSRRRSTTTPSSLSPPSLPLSSTLAPLRSSTRASHAAAQVCTRQEGRARTRRRRCPSPSCPGGARRNRTCDHRHRSQRGRRRGRRRAGAARSDRARGRSSSSRRRRGGRRRPRQRRRADAGGAILGRLDGRPHGQDEAATAAHGASSPPSLPVVLDEAVC